MKKKSPKELIMEFENVSNNTDDSLQPKKGCVINCNGHPTFIPPDITTMMQHNQKA